MKDIKVFGHLSPDTDATASAIVWSWFLTNHRNQPATAYVLGNPNNEALFVLNKWGFDVPPLLESISKEDLVTIVDTNNADELFANINDAEIVSIIDHHKLTGGLKTDSPREVVIQPYASTMTVMFNIMNLEPNELPKNIAGLMLSGILSDTLEFRSPTTTSDDEKLARELARALGININDYASAMFEAKSDISELSDAELIRMDSKVVEIKGESVRISVLETTNPQSVLDRRESLVQSIDEVCREDHVQHVFLFIVDILNQEAILLTHNDHVRDIAEQAFGVAIDGETVVLPGIVSRKKQIIPALSK
ncbi:manganese-dependent inorganic pyrophosphatase [Patescibacteria group bacterium]|nr:manganese-dependent inorganic pyrophosphatase [Patescibacteria group bacterium]